VAEKAQGLLVGQLIAAVVGVVLLLFSDFNGYYYREAGVEVYGYFYFGSGVVSTLVIGAAIAGLAVAAMVAVRALRNAYPNEAAMRSAAGQAQLGAGLAAALALVGGVVAAIDGILSDMDWWLDGGFYGALFGGALAVFFARRVASLEVDDVG
jgi:hypothetical protein